MACSWCAVFASPCENLTQKIRKMRYYSRNANRWGWILRRLQLSDARNICQKQSWIARSQRLQGRLRTCKSTTCPLPPQKSPPDRKTREQSERKPARQQEQVNVSSLPGDNVYLTNLQCRNPVCHCNLDLPHVTWNVDMKTQVFQFSSKALVSKA